MDSAHLAQCVSSIEKNIKSWGRKKALEHNHNLQ